jgi:hypothetical protein
MPLDPNIAMSYQPAQIPTVNALVNQSAQGMQNILATERQREADQMVRQDRETAALTRALAPAMAAAFSDPSDAGLDAALSLVPEQYRESMAAQVSQLRGIPDPNRRKDVMRSALLQDEIGQALLAQLEPTANARLNADMAAQRAALDRREQAFRERQFEAEQAAGGRVSPDVAARLQFEREKLAAEQDKPMPGKVDVKAAAKADDTLDKILSAYRKLNDLSAITSTKRTGVENLAATVSAKTGSTIGAAVGSEAQTQRQIIKNLRQALLNDIKAATGMSSKAIDSNVELQSFLNSLGDPENQSYEAAVATIGELSAKYAGGRLLGTAEEMLRENPQTKPAPGAIPQITSDEEYDALPSGTVYIAPDGQQRTKR